jgi:uncharacterized DUF497 family protein
MEWNGMEWNGMEWNERKNLQNQEKHGVSFEYAQRAFLDPLKLVAEDTDHSTPFETRYYCFGKIDNEILTIRFTYGHGKIRIFGAGHWRKGKKAYEQKNQLH